MAFVRLCLGLALTARGRARGHLVGIRKLVGVPVDPPFFCRRLEVSKCDLCMRPTDVLNCLLILGLDGVRDGCRLPDQIVLLLEVRPEKKRAGSQKDDRSRDIYEAGSYP